MNKKNDVTKYFEDIYEPFCKLFIPFVISIVAVIIYYIRRLEVSSRESNSLMVHEQLDIIFPWMYIIPIVITILFCLIIWFGSNQVQGIEDEFDIYSIKSSERSEAKGSGSFFLGCGSVSYNQEVKDYYVFFRAGEFGLIKDKLEAYDVEIIMRNDIKPGYKKVLIDDKAHKFLFVPENTIKENITIDL